MDATGVLETPSAAIAAEESFEIRSAVPVERLAIVAAHDPVLTEDQPDRAKAAFDAAWAEWQEQYLAAIARIWRMSPSDLYIKEDEKIRKRMDGKTPMLDFPRIRTRGAASTHFDLRHCVALCLEKEFSSKVWTRIGFPKGESCALDRIHATTVLFRERAQACTEWFYEQFFSVTAEVFRGHARKRGGFLEVTMIALRVDAGAPSDALDRWLVVHDRPNLANDELRAYIQAAGDIDGDVQTIGDGAFWVSLPTAVELPDRDLAPRKALFLVRPVGDTLKVVGIGLDDSETGDFANKIAIKLSRFFANQV